jgi:hypothetical protein
LEVQIMADDKTITPEEWRPVVGYENRYSVSSNGVVRRKGALHALKTYVHKNGYVYVTLCQQGTPATITIHKIVAAAFIGKRPEGQNVNHVNGRKIDNRADNLEYVTQVENIRHAHAHGLIPPAATGQHYHSLRTKPARLLRGENNRSSKLKDEQVREIRKIYAATPLPFVHLARSYGVTANVVRDIVRGKAWTHLV